MSNEERKQGTKANTKPHLLKKTGQAKRYQEKKRLEAEQRQATHNALSLEEKIKKAQSRGGSKKELKRLQEKLI